MKRSNNKCFNDYVQDGRNTLYPVINTKVWQWVTHTDCVEYYIV